MAMLEQEAAFYLAALIDGEGHIRVHQNRSVSFSNTEWSIIEAGLECCATLGLPTRIVKLKRYGNRRQGWEVLIYGKPALERFQELVPLRSLRKRSALADAIAAYKNKPRPPRDWLEQKYVIEGLSLQQVAEAWGCKSSPSAYSWMQFYGIPTRSATEGTRNFRRQQREAAAKEN